MKVSRVKINGIKNPVGFAFEHINLSYCIESDKEIKVNPELLIYGDAALTHILHKQDLDYSTSFCTQIKFIPQKETRYYFFIKCGTVKSDVCFFETGTDFDSRFIMPAENIANPVLFKEFKIQGGITSARLYITGVGLYEAQINSAKAGNEYLTPNCNDYDAALQYQTYDVTNCVKDDNKIEIGMGDGWYKGRFGLKKRSNIYGDTYAAAAKLVIKKHGDETVVISTDETWQARKSVVLATDIYDGEVIDDTADTSAIFAVKYYDKKFNIIPRISLPVICKHELKPELIVSPKGERILDFKQNMAGIIRFESRMKKGETIKLTVGEVMQDGCFYRDNLRTAKAEFKYTSDGTAKTVKPHFTFYGFRYALAEGLENVEPSDFTAEVLYSDMEETVEIKTDNPKINRLLENCVWGQRSNFVDVPTDCPQRDERLGWTGDAQVFSKTACYQADCKAFFDKFLHDMAVDQKSLGGAIAMYSPSFKESQTACSVWSDAATVIPWNLYNYYGDISLLKKHYALIENYVDKLISADDENGGNRLYNFGFHLGDWLSQDGANENAFKAATDEYFIASIYYYNSVKIAAKAAKLLGYAKKHILYDGISKEIRKAILKEYFTSSGRLAIDTQTAYALCCIFDVSVNRKKLKAGFNNRLKRDNYKVKGGFVGATQLIQSLISCGLTDDAFSVLYLEAYPSWLSCVNLGATTIWERWNALKPDGTISSTGMNSLNHYSFGAVAEAFYAYIAGLKNVTPGFKHVIISPAFNYRLKHLKFNYLSPSGEYRVEYEIEKENKVKLKIRVPLGCTATLKIEGCPRFADRQLKCGNYEFMIKTAFELSNPFSIDSTICDLLANEKSAAALKEVSVPLFCFLSTSDMGMNGQTFRYIANLNSFSLPEPVQQIIDQKLRAISV